MNVITVNTNALKHLSLETALSFIARSTGARDIELTTDGRVHAYEYVLGKSFDGLAEIFERTGTRCRMLSGGWTDFVRDDLGLLGRQIGLARHLGAKKIRFFYTNPRVPDDYTEKDFWNCAKNIHEQALLYPDIDFLIENHEGFFGTPYMMHRLMTEINLPNVGMVFDPGNFMIMEEGFEHHWDILGTVLLRGFIHVKDLTEERQWCTVGEGIVDWKNILAFLKKFGYTGDYSIEYLGHSNEESIGREEHLVKSYNNFKELLG
jgi:sugar phosphate isomerase/epimerase